MLDFTVEENSFVEAFLVMEYCNKDLAWVIDQTRGKVGIPSVAQVKGNHAADLSRPEITSREVIRTSPDNILLDAEGIIKIADFGMVREYTRARYYDGYGSARSVRPLTPRVGTIWYRAPELLLGANHYSTAVDIWSAGAIISELLLGEVFFAGSTEFGQLALIEALMGAPNEEQVEAFYQVGCPKFEFPVAASVEGPGATNHANASQHNVQQMLQSRSLAGRRLAFTVSDCLMWDPRYRDMANSGVFKYIDLEEPKAAQPSEIAKLLEPHHSQSYGSMKMEE
ncbi:kinase-like protein [Trichodelitschia bisporula]|uniref:cyclin-dependent kinase n=1 Tax=Trichodelitschia bisporula TaxID=703511 RepID=A0A6G1I6G8_9PEZI|nr:kinase-like protein [Trichodelitschia bisporula]